MNRRHMLAVAAGLLTLPLIGTAQPAYPNKLIRLYVPVTAGSATDAGARIYGEILGKLTGQPVVIDNRPGANGALSVQALKAAPADGHTILFASNSILSVNPVMTKGLGYDPFKDIKPIITLSRGAVMFAVSPDSPYKSIQELIAAAKREKRPLNAGNYTSGYELLNTWLGTAAGVEINHINYKGQSQMLTDLIGGRLDVGSVDSSGTGYELAKEGKLRILASTGDKRHPDLSNVPTMKESGFPDFESWIWGGLYVRSETPDDITKKLADLMQQAVRTPQAKTYQNSRIGSEALDWGPDQTRRFQVAEYERFRRIAAMAGVQPR